MIGATVKVGGMLRESGNFSQPWDTFLEVITELELRLSMIKTIKRSVVLSKRTFDMNVQRPEGTVTWAGSTNTECFTSPAAQGFQGGERETFSY